MLGPRIPSGNKTELNKAEEHHPPSIDDFPRLMPI